MTKRKKTEASKEKNVEKSDANVQTEKGISASSRNLVEAIKTASEGLYYVSETYAKIAPFVGGLTETINKEIFRAQIGKLDAPTEEKDFADFFARLTEIQDWFGDEETATAKKFEQLKEVLENNLRELKVYKVGKVQLDIYAVGIDAENTLLGIKTEAVET